MIRTLKRIQQRGHPEAVLAGGALRDLYAGNPVNDYDIFLTHPAHKTKKTSVNHLTSKKSATDNIYMRADEQYVKNLVVDTSSDRDMFGSNIYEEYEPFSDDEYMLNRFIRSVWSVVIGISVYQLVFLKKDPIEYVTKNFDLGICRAYCDGKRICYTPDFMNDMYNKTITFADAGLSQAAFDYAAKYHLPRVKKKFPDHKVVVHPANHDLVNDNNRHLLR